MMMLPKTIGTDIVRRLREKHKLTEKKPKKHDADGNPVALSGDAILTYRRARAAYRAELRVELRAKFRELFADAIKEHEAKKKEEPDGPTE